MIGIILLAVFLAILAASPFALLVVVAGNARIEEATQ